jgi:hypothetical protein
MSLREFVLVVEPGVGAEYPSEPLSPDASAWPADETAANLQSFVAIDLGFQQPSRDILVK